SAAAYARLDLEAVAVVADQTAQRIELLIDLDDNVRRLRVTRGVGERFLDHAVQRRLHRRRQALRDAGAHVDRNARATRYRCREELDRGEPGEVVEHHRPQLMGQVPQLLLGLIEDLLALLDLGCGRGYLARQRRELQVHGHQQLPRIVVQ